MLFELESESELELESRLLLPGVSEAELSVPAGVVTVVGVAPPPAPRAAAAWAWAAAALITVLVSPAAPEAPVPWGDSPPSELRLRPRPFSEPELGLLKPPGPAPPVIELAAGIPKFELAPAPAVGVGSVVP